MSADRWTECPQCPEEVARRDDTFREDFEISLPFDGAVTVSYSGGCEVCGLTIGFEHTHRFTVAKATGAA